MSLEKSNTEFIGSHELAPDFMKHNHFITRGYRIGFNSYWKLIKSLFMLHNESVNVWTHLIGLIAFFYIITHSFVTY